MSTLKLGQSGIYVIQRGDTGEFWNPVGYGSKRWRKQLAKAKLYTNIGHAKNAVHGICGNDYSVRPAWALDPTIIRIEKIGSVVAELEKPE